MRRFFPLLVLWLSACGDVSGLPFKGASNTFDADPSTNIKTETPTKTTPEITKEKNPSDTPENCQGFVTAVDKVHFGPGAGTGQGEFPDIVLGPPFGAGDFEGSFDVLSLGSGGEIILDFFPCLIEDHDGPDFIVFENVFFAGGDPQFPYHELAEISVSDDGETFHTFECLHKSNPYKGCAGWHPVYAHPENEISPFDVKNAGGESFDLADLGLGRARFIKIKDLEGRGGGQGVGFDLDAASVVNGKIVE